MVSSRTQLAVLGCNFEHLNTADVKTLALCHLLHLTIHPHPKLLFALVKGFILREDFVCLVFSRHLLWWHSAMGILEARCCGLNELFCVCKVNMYKMKRQRGIHTVHFCHLYNEY